MELRRRLASIVRWDGDDHTVGALEGTFLPVLKPAAWAERADRDGVVLRPLSDGDFLPPDAPQVAYAVGLGESVAFLDRSALPELLEPGEIHRIALDHLRDELQANGAFEEPDAEIAAELGVPVVFYSGSYYAAEALLVRELMQEAQARLGAEFIGVSVPVRGQLAAIDGAAPPEALARFAAIVAHTHLETNAAAIGPHVFAVYDGEIVGCLGGLEALQERVAGAVARLRADRSRRTVIERLHASDADGESVVLCVRTDDLEGALEDVEAAVRRFALEHAGDARLSGRIRVELEAPADHEDDGALRARLDDLASFLGRQLAELDAGPREGAPFSVTIHLGRRDDVAVASDAPSPDTSGEKALESQEPSDTAKHAFTEEETARLADAPYLVFLVVAAADGKVDEKEVSAFQKALVQAAASEHPVVHEMFARGLQDPEGRLRKLLSETPAPADALAAAGALISEKLPRDEANGIKMALFLLGKAVAEASGGFLGFGSRISKQEKKALAAVLLLLGIDLD